MARIRKVNVQPFNQEYNTEKSIIKRVNNKKILAPAGIFNQEMSLKNPIPKNETIRANSKIDALTWFCVNTF